MAIETNKPNFQYVWASGGAKVAPSDVKVQDGWTAEVPPFQWENWSQNRQDEAILHLFQKGISEWDALSNYYFTASGVRSYVQGSDGQIYVAVQDSVGQNPTTDGSDTYWKLAFASTTNATESVAGIVRLATSAETLAATSQVLAVDPSGLAAALAGARQQKFTVNGSFTVPAGVTTILVSGCAGGGGGGASSAGSSQTGSGGAGGGAGQSIIGNSYSVTPGQVIAITIGAGGAGGAVSQANGTSGGNTVVGSLVTLLGGPYGFGGGNLVGTSTGAAPSAVGYPSGGYSTDSVNGQVNGSSGEGGSSPFGGGGTRIRYASAVGINGHSAVGFGAGGGGGGGYYTAGVGSAGTGGAGAPGFIKIEW